jgi:uncharacterized DUF497 family protein
LLPNASVKNLNPKQNVAIRNSAYCKFSLAVNFPVIPIVAEVGPFAGGHLADPPPRLPPRGSSRATSSARRVRGFSPSPRRITGKFTATVFFDDLSSIRADPDHLFAEDRMIIIGHSKRNRLLFVSFKDGETIRLISARTATRREIKAYEKGY